MKILRIGSVRILDVGREGHAHLLRMRSDAVDPTGVIDVDRGQPVALGAIDDADQVVVRRHDDLEEHVLLLLLRQTRIRRREQAIGHADRRTVALDRLGTRGHHHAATQHLHHTIDQGLVLTAQVLVRAAVGGHPLGELHLHAHLFRRGRRADDRRVLRVGNE